MSTLIRRYTDVTSLIQILTKSEITLLRPQTWEDKNDAEFLQIYQKRNDLETLLALCLTTTGETHHHWKVFASGNAGVCIRFHKDKFLKNIEEAKNNISASENIMHNKVVYEIITKLEKIPPKLKDIPFIKRYPFRFEKEYRIIFTSKNESYHSLPIKIDLDSIKEIVFSPWIHKSLVDSLKSVLKSIDGCKDIKMFKTTVNENRRWINAGEQAN